MDHDQLLAGIAATSGDCLLFLTFDGTVLWASAASASILQWHPEELVDADASALASVDLEGSLAQNLPLVRGGEAIEPFVTAMARRDGSRFDAAVRLGQVRGSSGEVVGALVMVRDVTDERRTQRDLERALELSRAGFEQVRTPQAILDLRGRLTSVNEAWVALFGHPKASLIGRGLMTLVHPQDLLNATDQLAPLRRGEVESIGCELVFRDAHGRNLPMMLDATLLRESDNKPRAVAASVRDLTKLREVGHRLAAQESLYRALGRRAWDAAIVTDPELNIVYISPSLADMLGYQPEEIFMIDGWDLVHPEDKPRLRKLVADVASEPHRTERFVVRVRHKSGQWLWMEEALTNCLADPDIGGLVANLRDITEQVETQEALRLSDERHRAIVETAREGMVATAPDGATLFVNDKMAQILGLPVNDLYGMDVMALLREDPAADPAESPPYDGPASYELTHTRPDGTDRILSVSRSRLGTESSTSPLGWLAMVADVTEARRTEQRLRQQALHDPLTGLPNRYLLQDRLDMAEARQRRSDSAGCAVLFLDVDAFKSVNDTCGHEDGDQLLGEVAARLTTAVRAADTVARLGGDEFAIICEDTTEEVATIVAGRIHDAMSEPFRLHQGTIHVTVSIGVAMAPPFEFPDLLRLADRAMYEAKGLGGGRTAYVRSTPPST